MDFNVTPAKLRDSSDVIKSASNDFRMVIEELKNSIETVRTSWASEAADQFFVQFNKLNANFDSFEKVITQYSLFLNKTAEEYVSVDNRTLNDTGVLDGSALFA